jgi:hypothetical protein
MGHATAWAGRCAPAVYGRARPGRGMPHAKSAVPWSRHRASVPPAQPAGCGPHPPSATGGGSGRRRKWIAASTPRFVLSGVKEEERKGRPASHPGPAKAGRASCPPKSPPHPCGPARWRVGSARGHRPARPWAVGPAPVIYICDYTLKITRHNLKISNSSFIGDFRGFCETHPVFRLVPS